MDERPDTHEHHPDGEEPTVEELPPAPASDPTAGPRRLKRSREDRIFAGVAGGLGRHFDVDPIIFRIVFAALTLVGGLGIVLYLAALLFVPAEGSNGAPAETSRLTAILGGGALFVVALVVVGSAGGAIGPLLVLALLAGLGYAGYRALRLGEGRGGASAARVLTWALVGAGAAIGLLALAVASAWVSGSGGEVAIAGIVVGLGVALVIAALAGRGRRAIWLVLPALALAVPLGVVSAADVSFAGGVGERQHHPRSVAELPAGYKLGLGELDVDLRDVSFAPASRTSLAVGVGVGHVLVRVPRGVCVRTAARIGAGAVGAGDRWQGGFDVDERVRPTPTRAPELLLSGDIGMGALEVVVGDDVVASDDSSHDAGPFGDGRFETRGRQDPSAACVARTS